ncbi:MAG: GNAT family N-acetyltransferase [Oscillospiraceae bacterium]|jgi:predicted N-acetyltransferase YhbS/uncharacterized protein YdhG (YjbR/CyaY superfamily)|nr:GNAT family N-acetyltransferase [Oscillospiraceae bacterium]
MNIRLEAPADRAAVERLTFAAFETFTFPDGSKSPCVNEHYLAHIMRDAPAFVPELDFVGEIGGEIVANIMYTKSKITRPGGGELETLTFGPVSVKPALHGSGHGTEIIRHSLDRARALGYGAVVIVGHPAYYPRFGFRPASEYNLTMPDGGTIDAFMALELRDGHLGHDGGKWYEDRVFDIDKAAFEAWNKNFRAIDEYIESQPEGVRPLLKAVLRALRETIPAATEKLSWRMPTFWRGHNLIHFAAQKNHLGIYPGAEAMAHFLPRLAAYKTSKGAIQFPYETFGDEQLALIAEIAVWCGAQNG